MSMKVKEFDIVIEKDDGGWLVASVPALPGCYTQAKTMKALNSNIKEAIELHLDCLSDLKKRQETRFVAVKKVAIYA